MTMRLWKAGITGSRSSILWINQTEKVLTGSWINVQSIVAALNFIVAVSLSVSCKPLFWIMLFIVQGPLEMSLWDQGGRAAWKCPGTTELKYLQRAGLKKTSVSDLESIWYWTCGDYDLTMFKPLFHVDMFPFYSQGSIYDSHTDDVRKEKSATAFLLPRYSGFTHCITHEWWAIYII